MKAATLHSRLMLSSAYCDHIMRLPVYLKYKTSNDKSIEFHEGKKYELTEKCLVSKMNDGMFFL
jgi:hypothetical protein